MSIVRCGWNCYGSVKCNHPMESHQGRVVGLMEVVDDRGEEKQIDLCAIVWTGSYPQLIEYSSTRYWSFHAYAVVDATPDRAKEAEEWLAARLIDWLFNRARKQAREPMSGRVVTVIDGPSKGIYGEVVWYGRDPECGNRQMAGVQDDSGCITYLPAEEVKVVAPPEPNPTAIREMAAKMAANQEWWHIFGGRH